MPNRMTYHYVWLVMFVMQAIVFSPRFKPDATRWLIAPALAVLALG